MSIEPAFDLGFFIGRFQPIHRGHLFVVAEALEVCRKVALIVGSDNAPLSPKNPFTAQERMTLIRQNLEAHFRERARDIVVFAVPDFESNDVWVEHICDVVRDIAHPNDKITLIGHDKDDSTFYLKFFPQWGFVNIPNFHGINATAIREALFAKTLFDNPNLLQHITPQTVQFLVDYAAR